MGAQDEERLSTMHGHVDQKRHLIASALAPCEMRKRVQKSMAAAALPTGVF